MSGRNICILKKELPLIGERGQISRKLHFHIKSYPRDGIVERAIYRVFLLVPPKTECDEYIHMVFFIRIYSDICSGQICLYKYIQTLVLAGK